MDARQDDRICRLLERVAVATERIAAELEARPVQVTMRTFVDGVPTDPHTAYAVGDRTRGYVIDKAK